MSDILLGEEHNALVEMLLHRMEDVKNPDCTAPRIVVLRGASGVGKTRVIQEFYERLRSARGDAYWPSLVPMSPDSRVIKTDPLVSRKLVAPPIDDFVWPAGALPTFGWWGLNCEQMATGTVLNVATLSLQMNRVHLPPLLLARKRAESPTQKSQRTMRELTKVVRDAARDGSPEVLEEVLRRAGVSIPLFGALMGIGVNGIRASWRFAQERSRLRSAVTSGVESYRERIAVGRQVAEAWTRAAHTDVPVVVAVEDLHLMGADVGTLLEAVASQWTAPTLVVGTVWPEGQTRPVYRDWLERVTARGLVEIADVPTLAEDDLVRIVHSRAPNTVNEDAVEIARRLPNPLLVMHWLAQERTIEHIARHDDALVLRDEGPEWLPQVNEEILARRWNELDAVVRLVLTYAAAIEPVGDVVCRFSPAIISQVIVTDRSDLPKATVVDGMWRASEQSHWCRYEGLTECFVDSSLADYAREEASNRFGVARRAELRELAMHVTHEWLIACVKGIYLPDGTEASLIAQWYLELEIAVGCSDGRNASGKVIALWRAALDAAMVGDLHKACELGESTIVRLEATDESIGREAVLEVRTRVASWKLQSGCVDEALLAYHQLVPELRWTIGSESPLTLMARSDLLDAMVRSGKARQAIELYESLLSDQRRVLGPYSSDVWRTQRALAEALSAAGRTRDAAALLDDLECRERALGRARVEDLLALEVTRAGVMLDAGRNEEAVDKYEEVVAQLERSYGSDHEVVVAARGNLAAALRQGFHFERAVKEYTKLIDDRTRLFGARHPGTMAARTDLALMLREAGNPKPAKTIFDTLLADQEEVLGTDHVDTLTTRNYIASVVQEGGDPVAAVEMFKALLDDRIRVLGANHPDTLATRNNLALAFWEAGDPGTAADLLRELIDEETEIMGEDYRGVLTARNNLAAALWAAGKLGDAAEVYECLLGQMQVLDVDRVKVFVVRNNYARLIAEMGDLYKSASLFEGLLREEIAALGPDHPDTLVAWNNYGLALEGINSPAKASIVFEGLVKIRTRVLGADHPDTLVARSNLAQAIGDAGRPSVAIDMLEHLLKDEVRVHGVDNPDTFRVRGILAKMVCEVGAADKAVEMFSVLIEDMERVMGIDHPDALVSRGNLAAALSDVGRWDEAVRMLEALLRDQRRVLGDFHPQVMVTRGSIASMFIDAGEPQKATRLLQELLEDERKVMRADHPVVLRTLHDLAVAMEDSGDPGGAVDILEDIIEVVSRVRGSDNPDTLMVRRNLASALRASGQDFRANIEGQSLVKDLKTIAEPSEEFVNEVVSMLDAWAGED
ncbi:tetratricopeptide repeat protein [Actinomyces ruminicola]|uniref:Tetratricopeptide repeat-containing protein n=1 Tax=Actinomyces ruminicola TaxID=332524 RepID=A0A1G9U9K9_9ACTO|nr:tetratricopeptide repeat protein [Actinomyces ruminicola]SDM56404.1 Tetratricopeptide repeat-containing protein [Actinomyces ruminicola]